MYRASCADDLLTLRPANAKITLATSSLWRLLSIGARQIVTPAHRSSGTLIAISPGGRHARIPGVPADRDRRGRRRHRSRMESVVRHGSLAGRAQMPGSEARPALRVLW